MRESVTYQAILEEGREEGRIQELHRTILRLGRERFGTADETTRQDIEAIRNIESLEELSVRLIRVSSWTELLGTLHHHDGGWLFAKLPVEIGSPLSFPPLPWYNLRRVHRDQRVYEQGSSRERHYGTVTRIGPPFAR